MNNKQIKPILLASSCLVAALTAAQVSSSLAPLQAVENACTQLLTAPGNTTALQSLPSLARGIQAVDLQAAIFATYAMGMRCAGQVQTSNKTVQYLQQIFPSSPYLATFQDAQYQVNCPGCSGSGTGQVPCSRCKGKGNCSGCNGKGTIARLNKGNITCPFCQGSGHCLTCKGSCHEAIKCNQCFGRGRVTSKALMNDAYVNLIQQTKALSTALVRTAEGFVELDGRWVTPADKQREMDKRDTLAKAQQAENERQLAEVKRKQAEAPVGMAQQQTAPERTFESKDGVGRDAVSSTGMMGRLAAVLGQASTESRSVMVTTLAGRRDAPFESKDGVGRDAVFGVEIIRGIAVDTSGCLYVYDGRYRKITPEGVVTTLGGTVRKWFTDAQSKWAGWTDGFEKLAVDRYGNLYVQDWRMNHHPDNRVIWMLSPTGDTKPLMRGNLALWGSGNGNIYIGDTVKGTYWRLTQAGLEPIVSGNSGVPGAFAVDDQHSVYVSQQGWQAAIRKISPAGDVSILAGGVRTDVRIPNYADSVNGVGTNAVFSCPGGVAVDAARNVYVADCGNSAVRKIRPDGTVTTLAGEPGTAGGRRWKRRRRAVLGTS